MVLFRASSRGSPIQSAEQACVPSHSIPKTCQACGSPALRGERLCYFHHPGRRPSSSRYPRRAPRGFNLVAPRNRQEFQSALSEVIQRLANNKLDTRRGGLLVYTLQMAARDFTG
jgi:hypothetical protein